MLWDKILSLLTLPRVDACWCEVQFVFGLEQERLAADLQDGWWLHWSGDGEQSELRGNQGPILWHPVLTVEELEAAVELQGLRTINQVYSQTETEIAVQVYLSQSE